MSFLNISNDGSKLSTRSIVSTVSFLSSGNLRKKNANKPPLSYEESIKPKNKLIKGNFYFPPSSKKGAHFVKSQMFGLDNRSNMRFDVSDIIDDLENLSNKIHNYLTETTEEEISYSDASRIVTSTQRLNSMDEMISHISFALSTDDNTYSEFDIQDTHRKDDKIDSILYNENIEKSKNISPFIKVILRETDDILLFEKSSLTVPDGTEEANLVKNDNQIYEYLTVGKGRNRRKDDAETQTIEILYKSKCINTELIKKFDASAFVSNYDMYDTYEDYERVTKYVDFDNENCQKLGITTYKIQDLEQFEDISKTHRFNLAVMLIQRLLAGNVYHEKQKRFRNMILPNSLSLDVKYLYRLEILWKYSYIELGKSVSCMCWCPNDGDILAVAYGIFHIDIYNDKHKGYVAIWNIKNPINPERKIEYNTPVVCVEFSKFTPQLLAIGLYDGTIEVRDITDELNSLVSTNNGSKIKGTEPIVAMKWITLDSYRYQENIDEKQKQSLLAVSTDGNIIRYQLGSGLYLLGFLHIRLDRIELEIEGLLVKRSKELIEANRYPQIFGLILHPIRNDEFYALTDEGCYYRCSINYPQQYLDAFQLHQGSVFCMDWSPFSPKVFLTCGSDWYIRIWISGIHEPIISLSSGNGPVNCAYWSPILSFIIVSVTSKSVEVWDIRRNLLEPVSSYDFQKKSIDSFTIAKFSKCGRSIAIGDTEGNVIMASLDDMPFTPQSQYNELEKALYKATMAYPDLTLQIQNIGYFGYEDDKTTNTNNKTE